MIASTAKTANRLLLPMLISFMCVSSARAVDSPTGKCIYCAKTFHLDGATGRETVKCEYCKRTMRAASARDAETAAFKAREAFIKSNSLVANGRRNQRHKLLMSGIDGYCTECNVALAIPQAFHAERFACPKCKKSVKTSACKERYTHYLRSLSDNP